MKDVVMLWEQCESIGVPPTSIQQVLVTMVGLSSTSTHNSLTVGGDPDLALLTGNVCWLLSASGTCCDMEEVVALPLERYETVAISSTNPEQVVLQCLALLLPQHTILQHGEGGGADCTWAEMLDDY